MIPRKTLPNIFQRRIGVNVRKLWPQSLANSKSEICPNPDETLALQQWDDKPARKEGFKQLLNTISKEYRLIQHIGSSELGMVRSAERKSDQMPVAVKMVTKDPPTRWYDKFLKTEELDFMASPPTPMPVEVKLHQRVSAHEGVISLVDFIVNPNGNYVIVTARPPYVQNLFAFISENGQLDEEILWGFFKQVVKAVAACHSSGVVHRDLTDENILVDLSSGRILLIDFGSSAEWHSAAEEYENFTGGTRSYYPPEWTKRGTFNAEKSTIWSLGVVFYKTIHGDIPFDQEILEDAFDPYHKRKLPLHPGKISVHNGLPLVQNEFFLTGKFKAKNAPFKRKTQGNQS